MDKKDSALALQDVGNFPNRNSVFRSPAKSSKENVLYKELLAKGKAAAAVGNLTESLATYKKAFCMNPSEKIKRRIKSIEEVLKEIANEDEEEFTELDNGLIIFKQLVERLYPHQIEGVKWIYNLQKKRKKGGILADDMGLGKTIQVIAALSAMYDMELIRSVLLVLPLSLIPNWQKEFEKWAPGIKIKCFYGSVRDRTRALEYSQRRPSVCITTYGLVQTQWEQLGQTKSRQQFTWDYVILDEGHKIKNPSKTTKGVHAIPAKNRLILTGTPVQNNLRELWALFDWVTQGTLLGTQKTFKTEYETPITRARQRGASSAEIHLGNHMAESLRKIVDPYILRRTKGSVSAPKPDGQKADENLKADAAGPSFPKLKKKNDFVIWTYLSAVQENIYRDFLAQDSIKELLASKRSPLVYLNILKKICDHPRLLARRACQQLGLEANDSFNEEDFHTDKGKECAANRIDNISDETLIEESGKLQFLLGLLKRLREEGHRTLIFSLSRKALNIIHRILINQRFKVMRLDGTISKLSERELRVRKFQQDSSYEIFLLTTQVGGVGLTLTAADRVVIFDPSWNPATDLQAVDRIYRIGQDKNVVVYRLITCGTVEEKIYRRQIFKDSIIKQSTGDNKDPYRYFTNHELKELFQIEDTKTSMTQRQLQDLHSGQRCLAPELDEHLAFLHSLPMFGVSDHDLMFSQDPDDIDAGGVEEDTIKDKVAEARNKIQFEAKSFSGNELAEQRWGQFEFDWKKKPQEVRVNEEEPTFEIEGLYDKLDRLTVGDDPAENIFIQDKIPRRGDKNSDEDEKIPDSIKVEQQETAADLNLLNVYGDVIRVEDSPVKNGRNADLDMEIHEIDESSSSDCDLFDDENRNSEDHKDLLDADISCIPITSKAFFDASKLNEKDSRPENRYGRERKMENVSDCKFVKSDEEYAENENLDLENLVAGKVADPGDERSENSVLEKDGDCDVHSRNATTENVNGDHDIVDENQRPQSLSVDDNIEDKTSPLNEDDENHGVHSESYSTKNDEDVQDERQIANEDELLSFFEDCFKNKSTEGKISLAGLQDDEDCAFTDDDDDVKSIQDFEDGRLSRMTNRKSSETSLNTSDDASGLKNLRLQMEQSDNDEIFQDLDKDASTLSLLGAVEQDDDDLSMDGEEREKSYNADEGNEDDTRIRYESLLDDEKDVGTEEEQDSSFQSGSASLDNMNGSTSSAVVRAAKKSRRRSTAVSQPILLSSSGESDEDVEETHYTENVTSLSSEADDSKWSALELSIESEDESMFS